MFVGIKINENKLKNTDIVVKEEYDDIHIVKEKTGRWLLLGKKGEKTEIIVVLTPHNVTKLLGDHPEEVYYEVIYGIRDIEEFIGE